MIVFFYYSHCICLKICDLISFFFQEWNLYGAHPVHMTLEDDGKASMVFLKNSHAMGMNKQYLKCTLICKCVNKLYTYKRYIFIIYTWQNS